MMACSLSDWRIVLVPSLNPGAGCMRLIVKGTVLVAALLFIGISASMNALFLASFGRSSIEVGLLTSVSIAGDAMKAVLPVVLARAITLRAWAQASLCGVLLAIAIAMSVASGFGFAAKLRAQAVSFQDSASAALKMRETELVELERRLSALPPSRIVSEITTDIEAAKLDRAWTVSKSCTSVSGAPIRKFCERVVLLRGELELSIERNRYQAERTTLRGTIGVLRNSGAAADADPQAGALAEVVGIDRTRVRALVTTATALVLELGSIGLILLAAGSTLRGWREPDAPQTVSHEPVVVPAAADRTYWHRQRSANTSPIKKGVIHVSQEGR